MVDILISWLLDDLTQLNLTGIGTHLNPEIAGDITQVETSQAWSPWNMGTTDFLASHLGGSRDLLLGCDSEVGEHWSCSNIIINIIISIIIKCYETIPSLKNMNQGDHNITQTRTTWKNGFRRSEDMMLIFEMLGFWVATNTRLIISHIEVIFSLRTWKHEKKTEISQLIQKFKKNHKSN